MAEFTCLEGLVGVSAAEGTTPPESGLYVNSLPDINYAELSKLNDSDQADAEALWLNVEKRSILKFRTLFLGEVNKCFQISKIEVIECLICENKLLLATSLWYLLGAELMWERMYSSRLNRFTTVDRAKAKELNGEFMDLFYQELSATVAGLTICSECLEETPVVKNVISFSEILP